MLRRFKTRWLRYSIRTLLTGVTMLCIWLGWQVRIVQERKAVKQFVLERRGEFDAVFFVAAHPSEGPVTPSIVRGWLGDAIHYRIYAFDLTEEEFERVSRAFPEANVTVYSNKDASGPAIYQRGPTRIYAGGDTLSIL
jgi:hypothetical protein